MILERSGNPEGEPAPRESGGPAEKADELFETVRKRGRGLLHRQKQAAVEELSSVAGVMKEAAAKLETTDEAGVGTYVRKAADFVDGLSSSLRERELEDVVRETEGAIRERPAVCLALTAGVGFVFGRLLRASSQRIAARVQEDRPAGQTEGMR
jgi:ElaB/YqjD/DUF883 family membrane-anchored ribosome-binding protein